MTLLRTFTGAANRGDVVAYPKAEPLWRFQKYEGKSLRKNGLKTGMISHHGGLSSGQSGGLSSGQSLIRWSFITVVFHHGGLPSGWSLIRVIFHQYGLSSEWSFIRVISHQVVFHQGGLSSVGLSSQWSFIRVVSHQMVFYQGGLSSVGISSW